MKNHSFFLVVASAAIFLGLGAMDVHADPPPISFSQATNIITVAEYTQFLNAVAKTDPHHLYDPAMGGDPSVGNIERRGEDGNYSYSFVEAQANEPVMYVGTEAGMRFCNWESNGGTETGAYNMSSNGEITANPGASYLLTSEEEMDSSLDCNKVELVVVFNSVAAGQMFEESLEPVAEAAGEALGGDVVDTVITALGAAALGFFTGGRDGEITEHESSDASSHVSAFSEVHSARSEDWLAGTHDNRLGESDPRLMASGSPDGDHVSDRRMLQQPMTPPASVRSAMAWSGDPAQSGSSPKSDSSPEALRKASSGSGDHTSHDRSSSLSGHTSPPHPVVTDHAEALAKSNPEENRLTQENIARVAAHAEAQKRFEALAKQKEDLENKLQAINRALPGKKKAAHDAINNLTITQIVRSAFFGSSTSAKKAGQLFDESKSMVQSKNAISTQITSLTAQLQLAHNEVTRLSHPLLEPQQPSSIGKAAMAGASGKDGNAFGSSKKPMASTAASAPPKVWEAYRASEESKTDHRKVEADSVRYNAVSYPTLIPPARSRINVYGEEEKLGEPMKSLPGSSGHIEDMTTEEVRRRVVTYHDASEEVRVSKMWAASSKKTQYLERLRKAQQQFAIAEREHLEIPNRVEAERGHILAKYDIARNWLERMKDTRKLFISSIGRYLYDGDLFGESSRNALYERSHKEHVASINAARAYNEARINTLPPEEQQLERARLASLSEAERNQEIYTLAGVQGPRITPAEEQAAKEEYAAEDARSKARVEASRKQRYAEEQARADAEGRKYLFMTKAESDALEIKFAEEEAERAARRGSGGYGWVPPMQSSYQPSSYQTYSSPFRSTVDIRGHVHCSYNGTKLY